MGRKSLKKVRQKEIVKAFYIVSKREGLENTSIAKVAAHLDVNPSLIIHYFKSKQELDIALIDYILEKYLKIYKSKESVHSLDSLNDLIDKLFSRKWNRLFDDGVFYSCYAHIYRNKEFRIRFKQLHDTLRSILRESFMMAESKGVIMVDDVDQLTETVFALLEGAYYYLGLVEDRDEYNKKVIYYKQHVSDLILSNSLQSASV